jgi:hypothetical protein
MKKVIFGLGALFFLFHANGQSVAKPHIFNLEENDDFSGFELLDHSISGKRVIMTGENHSYTQFNARLEMKIMRYLHSQAGFKNIVLELGPARANVVNRFINNSDSMAEKNLKATTSTIYMELFENLKKWNLSLPDSMKIRVYGIDVERFNDLPLMRLSELLPEQNIPSRIRTGVDAIHSASAWLLASGLRNYDESGTSMWVSSGEQPFRIQQSIRRFIRYYDSLKPSFENWLGSNAPAVNEAVNWLREYVLWNALDNQSTQYVWREENIYRNITALLNSMPQEKFFGQFGRCHTSYSEQNGNCGWYGFNSVIRRLKTRYFKNDTAVLSIGVFYRGIYDQSVKDDNESREVDELQKKAFNRELNIFDLSHPDTDLPLLQSMFSYILLNNNYPLGKTDSVIKKSDTLLKVKYAAAESVLYYLGVGTGVNNRAELSRHLQQNGIGTLSVPLSFSYKIGSIYQQGMGYFIWEGSFLNNRNLAENDTAKYHYGCGQLQFEAGAQLIGKKHFQLLFGAGAFWGRELLGYEKRAGIFNYNPSNRIAMTNQAAGLLLGSRMLFTIGNSFGFGLGAQYQRDFSENKWYEKNSEQPYFHDALNTKLSGLLYSAWFQVKFNLD